MNQIFVSYLIIKEKRSLLLNRNSTFYLFLHQLHFSDESLTSNIKYAISAFPLSCIQITFEMESPKFSNIEIRYRK